MLLLERAYRFFAKTQAPAGPGAWSWARYGEYIAGLYTARVVRELSRRGFEVRVAQSAKSESRYVAFRPATPDASGRRGKRLVVRISAHRENVVRRAHYCLTAGRACLSNLLTWVDQTAAARWGGSPATEEGRA